MTAAIAAHRAGNPPHILQVYEVGRQTMLLSGAIYPVYQLMKDQKIDIDWQEEGVYHYGGRADSANWIFMNEECAVMPHSSVLIGSMKQSGLNWRTTMLPHWGDPYPKVNLIIGGATLWVLKGHSEEKYRGVAQFLSFVAQPEQQAWWHRKNG